MRTLICGLFVAAMMAAGGCGSKKAASGDAEGKKEVAKQEEGEDKSVEKKTPLGVLEYAAVTIPADLEPHVVVTRFMEALRTGNDVEAEALMTDAARKATMQSDYRIDPSGTPSSDFRIGKTTFAGVDLSHVEGSWTQAQSVTETVTYNVVWRLRKQQSGWRIVGFSPEVEPGVYTFLDFEKPAEMMREFKRAEARVARQPDKGLDEPLRRATLPALDGRSLR